MDRLAICGRSDVGKERECNEDVFLVGNILENKEQIYLEIPLESSFIKKYGLLVAVADGMGGHSAGEVASNLALNLLSRQSLSIQGGGTDKKEVKESIKNYIDSAHNAILDMSKDDISYHGMGTTIVGVYFIGNGFYVYHAGDSRLYRLRNGILKQLTQDHSLVQSLISTGQITIEQSYDHPQKNVIINSLGGGNDNCAPEVVDSYTAFSEDTFLLCSDGLSDMVAEDMLEDILNSKNNIQDKVKCLIDTANSMGGLDNITAVIINC